MRCSHTKIHGFIASCEKPTVMQSMILVSEVVSQGCQKICGSCKCASEPKSMQLAVVCDDLTVSSTEMRGLPLISACGLFQRVIHSDMLVAMEGEFLDPLR